MEQVVAFVPVKLNNQRCPGKNTRAFDGGEPLICYILHTLKQVKGLDRIVVYCSDESIREYLPEGVEFLHRSPELDRNSTQILDVLKAFAEDAPANHYVLAHATAPFLRVQSIQKGLHMVTEEGYDSALTVTSCTDFLWQEGKPLNYDPHHIPRTQDLPPLYVETTGLYIYSREMILEQNRRVGDHPYMIKVGKIEATDINESVDFEIANAIYNHII